MLRVSIALHTYSLNAASRRRVDCVLYRAVRTLAVLYTDVWFWVRRDGFTLVGLYIDARSSTEIFLKLMN